MPSVVDAECGVVEGWCGVKLGGESKAALGVDCIEGFLPLTAAVAFLAAAETAPVNSLSRRDSGG